MSRYEKAVSAELAEYLMDRGIAESTALTARLGEVRDPYPGHERYRGWLAIPYLDRNGKPLTVRFRRPDWVSGGAERVGESLRTKPGQPKYQSLSGDVARLYGVGAIHQAVANQDDTIHMTEGEFDALILNQEGFPAVAIPGATTLPTRWRVMLAGFSKVLVWGDGDDAGGRMVAKVTQMIRGAVPVILPKGKDVTDVFLDGGREALTNLAKEWGQDDEQED